MKYLSIIFVLALFAACTAFSAPEPNGALQLSASARVADDHGCAMICSPEPGDDTRRSSRLIEICRVETDDFPGLYCHHSILFGCTPMTTWGGDQRDVSPRCQSCRCAKIRANRNVLYKPVRRKRRLSEVKNINGRKGRDKGKKSKSRKGKGSKRRGKKRKGKK